MQALPLISVVIPVYNAEKYLKECVDSVLAQTYSNYEILLIDDGSADNSPEICDRYAESNSKIKVIHQKNSGVAEARNNGIREAKGEYIAFLDCDDWWEKEFLEKLVSYTLISDMAICKLVKVLPDGKHFCDKEYECDMTEWCWHIRNNISISCVRCLFKKEIILSHNLFFSKGMKTGEDQEFVFKYSMHIEKTSYVPGAVYYYRINNNSAMFQKNYNHFDAIKAMLAVEEYAQNNCSKDRAKLVSDAFRSYKYAYLLEFAVLTVLTAGETPKNVYSYLKDKGYDLLLDGTFKYENRLNSKFMSLWKKSHKLCLYYFYIKKLIGRMLRKTGIRR